MLLFTEGGFFFSICLHFNKSWRLREADRKWGRFEVLCQGSWEMSFQLALGEMGMDVSTAA